MKTKDEWLIGWRNTSEVIEKNGRGICEFDEKWRKSGLRTTMVGDRNGLASSYHNLV
jgi:hypothetical protein